jgi:hypothetical protein
MMNLSAKRVQRTVPLGWQHVREIRELVTSELAHLRADVRDAAAMTSSELLENAVKYADTSRLPHQGTFTLVHSENDLRIEISNAFASEDAVHELRGQIERISASADKEELYVTRLAEILQSDGETRGKLGLYRIAFEGAFDLQCTSVGDIVTVTATRRTA